MSSISGKKIWTCLRIDAIGAAASVAISLAAYFLLLEPVLQARDNRTAGYAELEARRAKLAQAVTSVASLKRDLESLERAVEVNPVELRSAAYSNQRLAEITNLASANGLNVDVLQTHPSRTDARFEIIPIHLAGTGTFRTCTEFLQQIGRQFPDTGISVIELADNPNDPSEKTTFSFALTWYAAPAAHAAAN